MTSDVLISVSILKTTANLQAVILMISVYDDTEAQVSWLWVP